MSAPGIDNRAVDSGEEDSQFGPKAGGSGERSSEHSSHSSEHSSEDAKGRRTSDLGRRTAGRILGLDVGARRIGMAVSDPLGITAQGIETMQRRNKRADFELLRIVIREYHVKEIVVGLPLRMSGAEGIQSDKMRVFAGELRKRFKLPVHLWDERLTSAEANRLLRETELSIEKRGKAVDRMAAVLILQGWMEKSRHPE